MELSHQYLFQLTLLYKYLNLYIYINKIITTTYLGGGSMEHAVSVQSDKFTSDGIPSNSFVRFRTVIFLLKFHANKRLSEPLITLK